ncbi:MAG: hemolysin expression modulating protein [Burkholderiales bacterium]|nr:hemolysin expression modulating protein [Burkholderiales bacterium]
MTVSTSPRPNLGSGAIKFIDGIPFEGLGSAGFDDNDLLIIGDELDNILEGGPGHDEIEGGAGNDIIRGGDGNGILRGGDGDDDIDGQAGTERLFGGDGNDILRAGGSPDDRDQLNGGTGNDTFGFYGAGQFRISDFTLGEDRLFFDSEILGINSVPELLSLITDIDDRGDTGFTAEFLGGVATIDLVGINVNAITADMIVFSL